MLTDSHMMQLFFEVCINTKGDFGIHKCPPSRAKCYLDKMVQENLDKASFMARGRNENRQKAQKAQYAQNAQSVPIA
ncbi:hypothetical protein HMPREF3155_08455 [Corynebacterium sp. HMSC06D04]|uniref:Uncharacterized protein n=1 Tax=Corynebacterium pseudogenitalium ATCC 33035 TaxID=525264 RepID=E2S769_9CORY|nr:hypothetical protein HMPREF0305_12371 [Corynebacterium pseudogenitalium ATCC 33035]OFT50522.1 hypothetical protein HMPREF3155_08455 [Corynebacterium sp. HMSC06D04]